MGAQGQEPVAPGAITKMRNSGGLEQGGTSEGAKMRSTCGCILKVELKAFANGLAVECVRKKTHQRSLSGF